MLSDDGIDFSIIVEPQDVASYSEWAGHLLVLPLNDQGLVFSRNFTINYAREKRLDWFWMVDDDITSFYKSEAGKNISISPFDAFTRSEKLFKNRGDVAQSAMEYQQYSWSQKKPITLNSYCDVCVCINVERTRGIKYRKQVTLKEDRDFTLQCLSLGYKTLRTNYIAFSCPKNGSNQGGLYEDYKSGLETESVREMCRLWGNTICSPVTKKDGRKDVKINWGYFKS